MVYGGSQVGRVLFVLKGEVFSIILQWLLVYSRVDLCATRVQLKKS